MDSLDLLNFNSVSSLAQSQAAQNTTDKLKLNAENAQTDEELLDACKQFESYLWEQVVKEMKNTVSLFDDEEKDANSQMVDFFTDNAISEVAGKMTEQTVGPNSLAMQMYEQLKRTTITAEELEAKRAEEEAAKQNETNQEMTAEEISKTAAEEGVITE